jgi:hypothetical protein
MAKRKNLNNSDSEIKPVKKTVKKSFKVDVEEITKNVKKDVTKDVIESVTKSVEDITKNVKKDITKTVISDVTKTVISDVTKTVISDVTKNVEEITKNVKKEVGDAVKFEISDLGSEINKLKNVVKEISEVSKEDIIKDDLGKEETIEKEEISFEKIIDDDFKPIENAVDIDIPVENDVIGRLLSRANYPVTVDYDDGKMVISPREVKKGICKKLLGQIPKEIMFVIDY